MECFSARSGHSKPAVSAKFVSEIRKGGFQFLVASAMVFYGFWLNGKEASGDASLYFKMFLTQR